MAGPASGSLPRQLPSQGEMAGYDARTISAGVSSLELMERAGRRIFDVISERRPEGPCVILCGPGNNGGDGLVIARLLIEAGRSAIAVTVSSGRYSPEFLSQSARLENTKKGAFWRLSGSAPDLAFAREISDADLSRTIAESAVLVDAVLGTGQREAPRGEIARIVRLASEAEPAWTVAVDTPTGINPDTGESYSPGLDADLTVSVQLVKRGLLQEPARSRCGEIVAVDIGISCVPVSEISLVSPSLLPDILSRRRAAHKGDHGHVLVIAGSGAMPGAAALAALGALRSGAGLVTMTRHDGASGTSIPPEVMIARMSGDRGFFEPRHAGELLPHIERATALAVGPGIGQAPETRLFLDMIVEAASSLGRPVVIDADALNLLSPLTGGAMGPSPFVLTPHPGEAARLLGVETREIQRDRYGAARRIYEISGATVVLKGAGTVIYGSSGGLLNLTGNPFMACGGTGDVLTGIIAALLAQRLAPIEAASLGAHAHGLAGDLASAASGGLIVASDIATHLPAAYASISRNRS